MAQGKEFTSDERESIIQSLRPFLEQGYSRNKACAFIGLPPQTLSNWVKHDEALGMKLTGWENALSSLALANIKRALDVEAEQDDARVDNSWRYLERKEESFKPKQDITTNDEKIEGVTVEIVTHETQTSSD